MAKAGIEVIFLAGRLNGARDCHPLRERLHHLGGIGYGTRLICLAAPPDHGFDDLIECPGIGRGWQRPFASRTLDRGFDSPAPKILHVLGEGMAEAGLVLAERWGVPYLLTLGEFPSRGFRLRLSRRWCRGIVATNRELAEHLPREFGVPAELIRWIPPGIHGALPDPNPDRPGRVPVVGAAGAARGRVGVRDLPERGAEGARRRHRRRIPDRRRGRGGGRIAEEGRTPPNRRPADLRRGTHLRVYVLGRPGRLLPDVRVADGRGPAPRRHGPRHPLDRHRRRRAPVADRRRDDGPEDRPRATPPGWRGRSPDCSATAPSRDAWATPPGASSPANSTPPSRPGGWIDSIERSSRRARTPPNRGDRGTS